MMTFSVVHDIILLDQSYIALLEITLVTDFLLLQVAVIDNLLGFIPTVIVLFIQMTSDCSLF